MNKNRGIIVSVIVTFIVTAALCFSVMFMFTGDLFLSGDETTDTLLEKINQINYLIDGKSIYELDKETAIENALYSYVATLDDDYATYFDKDYYEDYLDEVRGAYSGIGAQILAPASDIIGEDGLFIYRVIGNSPAEKAGIQSTDSIIAVDGNSISGMTYNDAVNSILGDPGTSVTVTVKRGETSIDFTVTRESFLARDVDYKMIDGDIGFIRIHEFSSETAYSQFIEALDSLISEGATGFIFDVRNNPGGDYETVVNILNLLVDRDELVILKYKDREEIEYSTGNRKTDLPCVVLINESSASAAELFSSALRDLNSAPLVGTTSYGKGVGQEYYELSDGSGLKFTTFHYMTKSRLDYDGIGLIPDYETELTEEQKNYFYVLDETSDPQLIKALEVMDTLR